LKKDRMKRAATGRRTRTASRRKSGRYVKSALRNGDKDIAVDATLRAAAPFQHGRGRVKTLLIEPEDLRYKQREKRMSHLVIFLVDGSGSMGARKRMVETKGAIQSLLIDCYKKRDRVALIVFRKERAEVVLPPTSSFELASRRLREIPVGGKTPLSAGLVEAYRLVKRVGMQRPETRCLVVLVTDGRANQRLTDTPVDEEMDKISQLLAGLRNADYIVVDTEDKATLMKMDLALQLADQLRAGYYRVTDLRSDFLTGIVYQKKKDLEET